MGKKQQTGEKMQKALSWVRKWKLLLILGGTFLLVAILAVILFGWDWTGFTNVSKVTITSPSKGEYTATITQPGKSFLDVIAILAIPVVVGFGVAWISYQQNQTSLQIAKDNRDKDLQIAKDTQEEATLKACMDDIKDLLLNKGLRTSELESEVAVVARTSVLSALRQLDGEHKRILIRFLCEAALIIPGKRNEVIFDLALADLSGINLKDQVLSGARLNTADLSGADLRNAGLIGTYLGFANLTNADLSGALLVRANLEGANLEGANLTDVDLTSANLKWAAYTEDQLSKAKSLAGATKSDGTKFP